MNIKSLFVALAVSAVGLFGATQANAGFSMSIHANGNEFCNSPAGGAGGFCTSGTNTITNPDQCLDMACHPAVRGPSAGNERVGIAATGSFSPTGTGYKMGFTSLTARHLNGSPADVTIALTYTDLTGPSKGSIGGLLNLAVVGAATVTVSLYADGTDAAFGHGSGPIASVTLTSSTSGYSLGGLFDVAGAALYSLTIVVEVQFKAGTNMSSITLNYLPQAVPEPGSLALLGMGLLLAGLAFRRRSKLVV